MKNYVVWFFRKSDSFLYDIYEECDDNNGKNYTRQEALERVEILKKYSSVISAHIFCIE